jgi:peptidoglycan hydrolase CwlO-like protein
MMSDLVERLRDPNVIYMTREAAAEAADEIERLQSRIDALHEHDGAMCPICAMENEIERLEADAENLRNTITSMQLSLKERGER